MAKNDKKNKPQNQPQQQSQPAAEATAKPANGETKKAPANNNTARGLVIVIGIAVLLVLAMILLGFLIAGILNRNSEQPPVDNSAQQITQEDATADDNSDNSDQQGEDTTSADEGASTSENNTEDEERNSDADDAESETADTGTTDVAADDDNVAATDGNVASATDSADANNRTYTYTAGQGDSVSWLARRAMYDYLSASNTSLDSAQRLFFEVNLTNQSSPVWVNPGEARTFDVNVMANLLQRAQGLSSAEHAAWQYQAQLSGYN